MKLTFEQKLTQAIDRNISVTANAGTGKTTVLVKRYIDILLHSFDETSAESRSLIDTFNPKNILAITFTKKAAAEMKLKVIKRIQDMIEDKLESGEKNISRKLYDLKVIRNSIGAARISTIHSFCSSLLRDFSVEAGILPNFFEFSESEIARLERETIINVAEGWLLSKDDSKSSFSRSILELVSKDDLIKLIHDVLQKRNIFEALDALYNLDNEMILEKRNKFLADYIMELIPKFKILYDLSTTIDINKLPKKKQSEFEEANSVFEMMMDDFDKGDFEDSIYNIIEFFNNAIKIFSVYFTSNSKKFYSHIIKNSDEYACEIAFSEFEDHFSDIYKIKEALSYYELDNSMLDITRAIFEMCKEIIQEMDEEKLELNGLDFDDLLIKSRDLLKNENVRKKAISNLDYIMVDEFQDTNDIQYDIIKSLIPELTNNNSEKSNINLFIVGDGKQSIYAFRNADVRVFMQARKDIQNLNQRSIDSGEISKEIKTYNENIISHNDDILTGKLDLKVTFRLNPVPASFVNYICRDLMKSDISEYDVEYSELIGVKGAEKLFNGEGHNIGNVSVLLSEDGVENEAMSIANYIFKIMNDPEFLIIDDENKERRPKFSDIGILSRKKKSFEYIGSALSQFNIPYIIHSGEGFFNAQEILDITSFLKFMHNPKDDISFASILRSPFFDIYDDKIYQISLEKGETLWEKFQLWVKNNYQAQLKLNEGVSLEAPVRAYNILTEMLSLAPRLTLSQLIMKILDECSWFSTVSISPGSRQKEANMEKFIQFARDFEERGFKNIYDFVEELEFIQSQEFREPEASFVSGEDAVAIMTIHAAKGLEFPLVILCDTNSGTQGNSRFFINDEFGISLKMNNKLQDGYSHKVDTPIKFIAGKILDMAVSAEEKRLLYVAMTRAISNLVISSNLKTTKNGYSAPKSFLKLILEGLDYNIEDITSDKISIKDNFKILHDDNIREIDLNYDIDIIRQEEKEQEVFVQKPDLFPDEIDLLTGIKAKTAGETFSATKLILFEDDKNRFIDRYVLGFPEEKSDVMIDTAKVENEDDPSGTLAGTLIHRTLENIKHWMTNEARVDPRVLSETIDRIIFDHGKAVDDRLRRRIIEECMNVASTELLQKFAANIDDAEIEFYLQMPINDNNLVGSIDMLIKNGNGSYEIWDWKSNNVLNKDEMHQAASHYEKQMKVYAGLFNLLHPGQEKIICRLLFTKLATSEARSDEWTFTYIWTKDQVAEFLNDMEKKIAEIHSL